MVKGNLPHLHYFQPVNACWTFQHLNCCLMEFLTFMLFSFSEDLQEISHIYIFFQPVNAFWNLYVFSLFLHS